MSGGVPIGNFGFGLPIAASTFAKDVDRGLYWIHGAMITIFVLWSIFFVYLLVRYRRREKVPAEHAEEGILKSLIPDGLVLLFEIGLIVFYAVPNWAHIKMRFPSEENANVVRVVAEQFAWDVHYPGPDGKFGRADPKFVDSANPVGLDSADPAGADDLVTINELHVPLGRPTLIYLTSKDVVHSLFIPEFRIKQDAIPGSVIPVWFEPTMTGHFELVCAQLCGLDHSMMRGEVVVHTPEDYAAWLKAQAAAKG